MMRSLFAGVSGLRNHQTRMDVIGNNIANVNTVGFKASRAQFQDVLSQTLQGAAGSQGNRGGTNPMQVGLGMGMASIDTIFTDGSFQPTGKQTDLSIQGQGFFVLSDGLNQVFTRAGNFDFDNTGNYLVPGTGYKVMGWMADSNGAISTAGSVRSIQIPVGATMNALPSSQITFANNLSATDPIGAASQTSIDVFDSQGATHSVVQNFVKVSGNTWLAKATVSDASGTPTGSLREITFDEYGKVSNIRNVAATGSTTTLSFAAATDFQLSNVSGTIAAKDFTVFDANGVPHSYKISFTNTGTNTWTYSVTDPSSTSTTPISSGTVNWDAENTPPRYEFTSPAGSATTTFTYPTGSANTYTIDLNNGTAPVGAATTSATINPTAAAGGISFAAAADFKLSNVNGHVSTQNFTIGADNYTISFTNTANNTWAYKVTDSTGATTYGTDTLRWNTTTNQYEFDTPAAADKKVGEFSNGGVDYTVDLTNFTKPDGGDPTTASAITPASTYGTGAAGNLVFTPNPQPGAAQMDISLALGNLTQFGGTSTVQATEQNGYAAGTLSSTTIDPTGVIVGRFSNGQSKNLAQVCLATFNNPAGLNKVGENLFSVSNNSGVAQIGPSGSGGRGKFNPGTLEMANVDLAQEFSNMIITQRGFQANSKIITVDDEMLQDLANLKR